MVKEAQLNISDLTIDQLIQKIRKRDLTCVEVVEHYLDRIDSLNGKINSFIRLNPEAIDEAQAIDKRISQGKADGTLVGVPIAIKDMLCTKNLETTAASKILQGFVPPYDSTVVANLKRQGAIVIGKLNQDEFAMGSSNENSIYGPCRNPWNLEFVPGGSSGGSAATVAARLSPGAVGTDTGGSIRQPANFCGIVGLKPTYGRVSRWGIVAFASSLDQAGPMTRTVKDSALMLEAIAGHDSQDMTSSSRSIENWAAQVSSNISGLKIGIPKEFFRDELDEDVRKVINESIEIVKSHGAKVVDVTIPLVQHSIPIYYLICTSEASSNLARYDGIRFGSRSANSSEMNVGLDEFYEWNRGDGFGNEVKRRIMLGTYALSSGYYDAYYKKACQVRRLLLEQFQRVFSECDALLAPVTTSPAFKIGTLISSPLEMYLNDILTTSANLAGLPALSVPAGFSTKGLPIGVQLISSHWQEQKIFNIAYAIEQSANVWEKKPNGF